APRAPVAESTVHGAARGGAGAAAPRGHPAQHHPASIVSRTIADVGPRRDPAATATVSLPLNPRHRPEDTDGASRGASRRASRGVLLAIVVLTAAIRLWNIGDQPVLYFDSGV